MRPQVNVDALDQAVAALPDKQRAAVPMHKYAMPGSCSRSFNSTPGNRRPIVRRD